MWPMKLDAQCEIVQETRAIVQMSDTLSEMLRLAQAKASVTGRLAAGGDWSLAFPAPEGVKFNAVVTGACWLTAPSLRQPVRLTAGDGFVLTRSQPYGLSSDPDRLPSPAGPAFSNAQGGWARVGVGEDVQIIGGQIALAPVSAAFVLSGLAPLLVAPADAPGAERLLPTLRQLVEEVAAEAPGAEAMADALAQTVMVLLLRLGLSAGAGQTPGWARALADPNLARILALMQGQPARAWTVADLAREAGMSRSSFSDRFGALVGQSPIAFLADWRLHLAATRLAQGHTPPSEVAAQSGYASEGALSVAFKRRFGVTPARYRRDPSAASRQAQA